MSSFKISDVREIYISKMRSDSNNEDLICELKDILSGEDDHNSIPCNLLESLDNIVFYLDSLKDSDMHMHHYRIHIMNMYLVVENIFTVLKFLNIDPFKLDVYNVFKEIKKWANFFKHPKSFLLIHHPNFIFDNEILNTNEIIINKDFVYKYYTDNKNNDELKNILINKKHVQVQLSNPLKLTESFCDEVIFFIESIKGNEEYIRSLKSEFNLSNFMQKLKD